MPGLEAAKMNVKFSVDHCYTMIANRIIEKGEGARYAAYSREAKRKLSAEDPEATCCYCDGHDPDKPALPLWAAPKLHREYPHSSRPEDFPLLCHKDCEQEALLARVTGK